MSNGTVNYDEIDLTGAMTANAISVNATGGNIRFGNQTATNTISIASTATGTQTFRAGTLTANGSGVPLTVSVPNLTSITGLSTPSELEIKTNKKC